MSSTRTVDPRLRLVHVSPGHGDFAGVGSLLTRSLQSGVPAVLIREPKLHAAEIAQLCERLRPVATAHGAVVLVSDRADVAAAGLADGVHLGFRSLSAAQVRRFAPDLRIGCSVHDPQELRAAEAAGADFVFLSPVHATDCKPGARPLGLDTAEAWTRSSRVPVIWLGGFDAARMAAARDAGVSADGFAVLGALSTPERVDTGASALLRAATGATAETLGVTKRASLVQDGTARPQETA